MALRGSQIDRTPSFNFAEEVDIFGAGVGDHQRIRADAVLVEKPPVPLSAQTFCPMLTPFQFTQQRVSQRRPAADDADMPVMFIADRTTADRARSRLPRIGDQLFLGRIADGVEIGAGQAADLPDLGTQPVDFMRARPAVETNNRCLFGRAVDLLVGDEQSGESVLQATAAAQLRALDPGLIAAGIVGRTSRRR
jgi:hypothetical protein